MMKRQNVCITDTLHVLDKDDKENDVNRSYATTSYAKPINNSDKVDNVRKQKIVKFKAIYLSRQIKKIYHQIPDQKKKMLFENEEVFKLLIINPELVMKLLGEYWYNF